MNTVTSWAVDNNIHSRKEKILCKFRNKNDGLTMNSSGRIEDGTMPDLEVEGAKW